MPICPVREIAHKYERLAAVLSDDDDKTFEMMSELANSIDQLNPESITGAAFMAACAIAELDAAGGSPALIRLASERRALRLFPRVFLFLADHSDELPATWSAGVCPAGDDQLLFAERQILAGRHAA